MLFRSFASCVSLGFVALMLCLCGTVIAQEANSSTHTAEAATPATDATHAPAAHSDAASHSAGGHHEATTPDAINGDKGMENLLDFRSDKAIWTAVVFLIMMAVLWFVAWTPITEALERRERMIANNIADAKNASDQAIAKLKEYEARLATAASEATEIVTQARKDAEHAGQRIINESQEEAARQRDRALADIESAKQLAISDIASRSTDMAFGLARRVVGRELNTSDHQQLIQDAVSKLPSRN